MSRPARVIAVLGPDGAGKSTLIEALGQRLAAGGVAWRRFHWRVPWTVAERPWTPVTDPHARPPRGALASVAKLAWYALSAWPCWWRNVRPFARRGGVVILDRWYDDLLCDPRRYRYGAPLAIARAVRRLVPRPDRVLVLVADPAAIAARKREVDAAELARQVLAYRRLAERRDAVALDCAAPIAVVAAAAWAALAGAGGANPVEAYAC